MRALRRGLSEFLALPFAIVVGFVALAFAGIALDDSGIGWVDDARSGMAELIFGSANATSTLLGHLATGLITMTSITLSLVLLAVQQSTASMTHSVIDQFLRRRMNQVVFGVFVGLTIYALIVLASVQPAFNPVLSATLALVLALLALAGLLLLVYTTIHQMRPAEIAETTRHLTEVARDRQRALLARTRRQRADDSVPGRLVEAHHHGFVTGIGLERLAKVLSGLPGMVEVVLHVRMGDFVTHGQRLGEILPESAPHELDDALRRAVVLEPVRDIRQDPAYGVEQLVNIAWTSASSSKQNPEPALLVNFALRDLLARWAAEPAPEHTDGRLPVVYRDDVFDQLISALELLAVSASESMQSQTFTGVVETFAFAFERLEGDAAARTEDAVTRILSALGDEVLTAELDRALQRLADILEQRSRPEGAQPVRSARDTLAGSLGLLNSRSSRVPTAG